MKGFNQTESAYSATAKSIVFVVDDEYDVAKLDNPVRRAANYAVIAANVRNYQRLGTL